MNATPPQIDFGPKFAHLFNRAYYPLLRDPSRFEILYGGAGSGKSDFAASKCLYRMLTEPGHRIACIRKVARTHLDSTFKQMGEVIDRWGIGSLVDMRTSPMSIRAPGDSAMIFKGMDKEAKLKSITGVTSTWLEEPTELSEADLDQVDLRLRSSCPYVQQHILSFNPISIKHWLKRRFFDKPVPNTTILKTTHLHNRFITPYYREVLKGLGNASLRAIYERGEWGELEGLVYDMPDTVTPWPEDLGDDRFWGLDFGFANPSALIEVTCRDRRIYATERLYRSHLVTSAIIERLNALDIAAWEPIYCDSAEPARIAEISAAGFNAQKADKDVMGGIDKLRDLPIHVAPGSQNLIDEFCSYCWAEDQQGNALDRPVKFNDHALDALRYAVFTHLKFESRGFGSFNRAALGV